MILSYLFLALAALSLAALGVCAWMGMKTAKKPEALVEELEPWLKRVLISGLGLLVFFCLYLLANRLGGVVG